jgi:2'-5' RNA ligase
MMRCFIAIDIEERIRVALRKLQQEMAEAADIKKSDVKWVHPDSMHLTLKFLGEVRDRDVLDICNIVKAVAAGHKAFDFVVNQVGYFGGQSARVLWVGAGLDCPELLQLQQDLEEKLASIGWPQEGRKFSGHLTLCRVRNSRAGFELAKLTEQYQGFDLGAMRCDTLTVYESKLRPEGPLYTSLGNYRLL